MARTQPQSQTPAVDTDGDGSLRGRRVQDAPAAGERNSNGEAEDISTKENASLRALHALGRVIQRLWEEVEREGGATVTAGEAGEMLNLHRTALENLPKASSVDKRLHAIEQQVTALTKRLPTVTKPTWAAVAAAPITASFGSATALPSQRNAITIRPPQEERREYSERTPAEILQKVRTAIPGAVAAQTLRSGDIRITMASTQQKETTLNNRDHIRQTLGAKVLRQDYPVEVQAVPTSIPVQHGKTANNTKVIQEMAESTRRLIPNFSATRVMWIHGEDSLKPRRGETRAPRHASLIVYVPTAELQKKAVQQGIIIEGVIYPTRLYDSALQPPRCFRCNRWGHTQSSCHAKETCGHCAGEHDTQKCRFINDPSMARCCNCGKGGHRAWQTSRCQDYKRRQAQREESRKALESISLSWRTERDHMASLPLTMAPRMKSTPTTTNEVLSGRKRDRPSQPETPQDDNSRRRGPGRPAKVAPVDPLQPSLDSFTRQSQPLTAATSRSLELVPATQNPWDEDSQTMDFDSSLDLTQSQC